RDQKPAEKLAGHFARYADCAALEPSSPDFKGEAVVVVEGADIGAQLPQGLEQGGDGPAPQLVGAVDQPRAFGRGCEGPGEKAGRGAGRTEKELAAGVGPHAGAAVDGDRVAVDGDGDTQSPQGVDEPIRVVAFQDARQDGAALGQGGDEQRPVGEAFGTGDGDLRIERAKRGMKGDGLRLGGACPRGTGRTISTAHESTTLHPARWPCQGLMGGHSSKAPRFLPAPLATGLRNEAAPGGPGRPVRWRQSAWSVRHQRAGGLWPVMPLPEEKCPGMLTGSRPWGGVRPARTSARACS